MMDPKQEKNFIDIPRHRISERRPAKLGPDRPLRDGRAENDLAASHPPAPTLFSTDQHGNFYTSLQFYRIATNIPAALRFRG
jgi:hypothetical protein